MQNLLRGSLRSALRVLFRGVVGLDTPVAFQRRWVALVSTTTFCASGTRYLPAHWNGVRGEWVTREGQAARARQVMLYLHGGGYTLGSPRSHRAITSNLARACDMPLAVPDYRLAPEHPYPAALEDAISVYRALLDTYRPRDIVFGGDSAGGGLALSTALALRQAGLPMPAALVLLSPWTDLSLSGDSHLSLRDRDPMLSEDWLRRAARDYRGSVAPDDPRVSPLFDELHGLPPILLQLGSEEILRSDAERLAERAAVAGVEIGLDIEADAWHDFQLHAGLLRQSDAAIARIAGFVRSQLSTT